MRFRLIFTTLLLILPQTQAQPDSPVLKMFYLGSDPKSTDKAITKISSKVDTPLKDDDLKELAQFTEVKAIYLNGRKITGVGLKHLADLKKLETLELAFTTINSDGFKELSKLKQLKRLNIVNTGYTAENLKALTALTDLEMLWMGQNFNCDDKGYQVLGEFKKLRGIAAGNSNFGDGALKVVAGLPELRILILHGSKVTDDGLEPLAKAPKLERFKGNFNMTDKGLAHLGKIDTLRAIDLYSSDCFGPIDPQHAQRQETHDVEDRFSRRFSQGRPGKTESCSAKLQMGLLPFGNSTNDDR